MSLDMKHAISMRWLAKSMLEVIASVLVVFGAHVNSVFIIEVKICAFVKWSYSHPPIMFTTLSIMFSACYCSE